MLDSLVLLVFSLFALFSVLLVKAERCLLKSRHLSLLKRLITILAIISLLEWVSKIALRNFMVWRLFSQWRSTLLLILVKIDFLCLVVKGTTLHFVRCISLVSGPVVRIVFVHAAFSKLGVLRSPDRSLIFSFAAYLTWSLSKCAIVGWSSVKILGASVIFLSIFRSALVWNVRVRSLFFTHLRSSSGVVFAPVVSAWSFFARLLLFHSELIFRSCIGLSFRSFRNFVKFDSLSLFLTHFLYYIQNN